MILSGLNIAGLGGGLINQETPYRSDVNHNDTSLLGGAAGVAASKHARNI